MSNKEDVEATIIGKNVRRTIGTCRQYAEQSHAWKNGEGKTEDQLLQRIWNLASDSLDLIDTVHAVVAERDEARRACEKAIRERQSLEIKEDDWHSAYERAVAERDEARQGMRNYMDSNAALSRSAIGNRDLRWKAEAEREILREALEQIADHVYDGSPESGRDLRLVARAALERPVKVPPQANDVYPDSADEASRKRHDRAGEYLAPLIDSHLETFAYGVSNSSHVLEILLEESVVQAQRINNLERIIKEQQ